MNPADALLLAGRVIVGGYFLQAGWNHFRNRTMLAGYAALKKVPFPMLSILGTGLLLSAGGLSLILGLFPYLGVAALVAFLVGVTPMIHDFWTIEDPMQRMGEKVNFAKNVALLGAVLLVGAIPQPWAHSLATGL